MAQHKRIDIALESSAELFFISVLLSDNWRFPSGKSYSLSLSYVIPTLEFKDIEINRLTSSLRKKDRFRETMQQHHRELWFSRTNCWTIRSGNQSILQTMALNIRSFPAGLADDSLLLIICLRMRLNTVAVKDNWHNNIPADGGPFAQWVHYRQFLIRLKASCQTYGNKWREVWRLFCRWWPCKIFRLNISRYVGNITSLKIITLVYRRFFWRWGPTGKLL